MTATDVSVDESAGPTANTDHEEVFTKDDTFHVLQNERRRKVIEFLTGIEGKIEMRDVAEQVAAWEHDTTTQALRSDERQRVYIALYQSHLPKLDKLGIINYNQSRGIVEPLPRVDELAGYLEQAESDDDSAADTDRNFALPYLGVSAVGAVFVALTLFNVPGFAALSSWLVSVGLLATFALLSVFHATVEGFWNGE